MFFLFIPVALSTSLLHQYIISPSNLKTSHITVDDHMSLALTNTAVAAIESSGDVLEKDGIALKAQATTLSFGSHVMCRTKGSEDVVPCTGADGETHVPIIVLDVKRSVVIKDERNKCLTLAGGTDMLEHPVLAFTECRPELQKDPADDLLVVEGRKKLTTQLFVLRGNDIKGLISRVNVKDSLRAKKKPELEIKPPTK